VRQLLLFTFVIFLLVLLNLHRNSMEELSLQLQSWCSSRFENQPTKIKEMNQALACGISMSNKSEWKALLLQTGLYHVVVVSGSHLVLLELALARLPSSIFVVLAFILTLLTGIQPPLVRGLIQRLFLKHQQGPFQIACSYWLCLAFFPAWLSSMSLALSTAASMGLTLQWRSSWRQSRPQGPQGSQQVSAWLWRLLLKLFGPWAFSLLLLNQFQQMHLVQILCNLIWANLATFLLAPLSYLQLVFSFLNLTEVHLIFFEVLTAFSFSHNVEPPLRKPQSDLSLSFILFLLFISCHFWNLLQLRKDNRL